MIFTQFINENFFSPNKNFRVGGKKMGSVGLAETSMFFVRPYLLLNCKNVFDRRRDSNFDIKGDVSQIKCEITPSVYVIFLVKLQLTFLLQHSIFV